MRLHLTAADALKYGGIALIAFAVLLVITLAGASDSSIARLRQRYVTDIDKSLRVLALGGSGRTILIVQGGVVVALISVRAFLGDVLPYWYIGVAVGAFGPSMYLANARRRRIDTLEEQIDGFILAFSNALRTVPSPSAALQTVVEYVPRPTKDELERTIKELRVGNTLDQALVNMSARIGSRQLDAALTSVLVGLQIGGNLPMVLETTAGTVRDMRRLEGIVQAKTGESRAQLWVLAAIPFLICGMFQSISPGYFAPLTASPKGLAVIGLACTLWATSLLMARKILAVEI